MTNLYLGLLVIGALVLLLGMVSGFLKRKWLSARILALLIGFLLGPSVFGVFNLSAWGSQAEIMENAARITLGIGLMGVALRLPHGYTLRDWRTLLLLLASAMPFMWLLGSLITYLILGHSPWVALLIGAVIAPTDPIVASTIATGEMAEKYIPERIRNLISAESGLNDGLAYPFVLLPVLWMSHAPGEALLQWLTQIVLLEVGLAALLGALIGYSAGLALKWAEAHHTIDHKSFLAYTLALALLALGLIWLIGSDAILGVFIAGLAFTFMVDEDDQFKQERVVEAISTFFTLPIFTLLGLALPWQQWLGMGWRALALILAILIFRRIPIILALKPVLKSLQDTSDALFMGWFGPIGVSALFYASLALRRTDLEQVWVVGTLLICASVLVYGISAAVFTRLYGKHHPHQ